MPRPTVILEETTHGVPSKHPHVPAFPVKFHITTPHIRQDPQSSRPPRKTKSTLPIYKYEIFLYECCDGDRDRERDSKGRALYVIRERKRDSREREIENQIHDPEREREREGQRGGER